MAKPNVAGHLRNNVFRDVGLHLIQLTYQWEFVTDSTSVDCDHMRRSVTTAQFEEFLSSFKLRAEILLICVSLLLIVAKNPLHHLFELRKEVRRIQKCIYDGVIPSGLLTSLLNRFAPFALWRPQNIGFRLSPVALLPRHRFKLWMRIFLVSPQVADKSEGFIAPGDSARHLYAGLIVSQREMSFFHLVGSTFFVEIRSCNWRNLRIDLRCLAITTSKTEQSLMKR